MKKILLSIFALCVSLFSFSNISLNNIEYTIDTLSMFPVGPGTTYYELRFLRADNGKGRLDAFLLAIDTRNPYVHVEQVLGTGKITGTETPSKMAIRSTTDSNIFFAGANGDFFTTLDDQSTSAYYEVGIPVSTTIVNSEYAYTPVANRTERRLGAIDTDGKGITAIQHAISMKLQLADTTLDIAHANYVRRENELVIYNYHNGATTATNAYGTEVQIELLDGEQWQTTGTMRAKVIKVEQQVGSMPLDKDHAVLSGHGTMADELSKLNVGDELTLDFEIRFDGDVVNIAQAIGSDNYNQILLNGKVVQDGFWNELHPRTGFGTSLTRDTVYMLVVDGRGVSAGCTTKVLGEILQHYGAYNAVNWDGGGSSCVYVRPLGPMNNGSDGQERACGNGMFAVADVPEVDNTIVTIAPYMPNYYLPRYGVAAPQFLGYNKYGVLVETNVTGVQLSCAPEVGEILADGRFLASGENGGTLTATWGEVTTELDVRIITSAPIAIRLDSVLCDALHPYKVEVQGTVGNATVEVLADALDWISADPTIASVNEAGEVVGHKNGRVLIVGTLGDFSDSIIVNVEVAEANKQVWDDFRNAASWEVKGSPTSFKPSLSVPEDIDAPVNLLFTYASGRNPFVQLSKDSLLYSLPEKILVPMTTNATFEKVIIMIRANNSNTTDQITFLNPAVGEENIFEIDVKERFGADAAIYPLRFLSLKMIPTSATPKGECYVTLPGIIEVYSDNSGVGTGIENNINTTAPSKFIESGQLFIQRNGQTYTILGTLK
ncbi:MAG: phosphodiester glycosidase family protein [Paludibacteraceae bacterium]|nr:phosphodiester glycosidase family protein [Paludibacteraceae bacterium]